MTDEGIEIRVEAAIREADTHVCDAARDYRAMAIAAIDVLAELDDA